MLGTTWSIKYIYHLCQNGGYHQKYFSILFFKYKDYTHNYGPVKKKKILQPHNFIY